MSNQADAGSGMEAPPQVAAETAPPQDLRPVAGRLRGRDLTLARAGWWALFLLTVGLLLRAIPASFAYLSTPCSRAYCGAQLTSLQAQALSAMGWTLSEYAAVLTAIDVLFASAFIALGVILFLRKSSEPMALYTSVMLIAFGPTARAGTLEILRLTVPAFHWPVALLSLVGGVMWLPFMYLFPTGRFVPRWTLGLTLAWTVFQLYATTLPEMTEPVTNPVVIWSAVALFLLVVGSGVAAQAYRYRRVSTSADRQKTKWVVYGAVVSLCGFAGWLALSALLDLPEENVMGLVLMNLLAYLIVLILPISIAVAVLRAHLWDIALVVNRTLIYVPVTALLTGLFAAMITVSQKLFVAMLGQPSDASAVLATLVVVAAFTPLKDTVQKYVDRRFKETPASLRRLATFGENVQSRESRVELPQISRRFLHESAQAFGAAQGAVYLDHEGTLELCDTVGEWNGQAALSVPLMAQKAGRRLGLLSLGDRIQGRAYTERERQMLQEVAAVVAQAVEQDQTAPIVRTAAVTETPA